MRKYDELTIEEKMSLYERYVGDDKETITDWGICKESNKPVILYDREEKHE